MVQTDFAEHFDRRSREVFASEDNRARVGRSAIDQGLEAILPAFAPCHQLTLWFKPMFKSTVCSEITGVNWFDVNEVVNHYLGPRGPETIGKCATLTGTTAVKVAEILAGL